MSCLMARRTPPRPLEVAVGSLFIFFERGLNCVEVPSCLFDITRCVCEWEVVFGDYYGVWILGSWVCKKCSPFPLCEALDVN